MPKCRDCGANLILIQIPSGKQIPCDPEKVRYWAKEGAKGFVLTPSGEFINCEFTGDPEMATGVGFLVHWSSCPVSGVFRGRRCCF